MPWIKDKNGNRKVVKAKVKPVKLSKEAIAAKQEALEETYKRWPALKEAHLKSKKRDKTLNTEALMRLMMASKGNMSEAARCAGVHRVTFHRWLKEDGIDIEAMRQMDEIWDDVAEGVVNGHIEKGDLDAAKFRLETKAKRRGYTKTLEVDQRVLINVKIEES